MFGQHSCIPASAVALSWQEFQCNSYFQHLGRGPVTLNLKKIATFLLKLGNYCCCCIFAYKCFKIENKRVFNRIFTKVQLTEVDGRWTKYLDLFSKLLIDIFGPTWENYILFFHWEWAEHRPLIWTNKSIAVSAIKSKFCSLISG